MALSSRMLEFVIPQFCFAKGSSTRSNTVVALSGSCKIIPDQCSPRLFAESNQFGMAPKIRLQNNLKLSPIMLASSPGSALHVSATWRERTTLKLALGISLRLNGGTHALLSGAFAT